MAPPTLSEPAENTGAPKPAPKRFDDRSQTAISVRLSALPKKPTKVNLDDYKSHVPGSHTLHAHIVRWSEAAKISRFFNHDAFAAVLGKPTCFTLTPSYIVVGTLSGHCIGFNYHQQPTFVLEPPVSPLNAPETSEKPVSCLALSNDGLMAAAGLIDGSIVLWSVPLATPADKAPTRAKAYDVIAPISREDQVVRKFSGHLRGAAVNTVAFVGDLAEHIVSSDIAGLVYFHHIFRKFLRKYAASHKLMGQNDPTSKFSVHDCALLPQGTSPQITDALGVLAVITSNVLVITSVRSLDDANLTHPVTHFKISRPKSVTVESGLPRGCLAWYPCLEKNHVHGHTNAKLAYSWNNVVTILELQNSQIPANWKLVISELKDKNKGIPNLPFKKTSRWIGDSSHSVLALEWLNSEILTALVQNPTTTETKLYFFYYKTQFSHSELTLLAEDGLDSQQISSFDFPGTEPPLSVYNYSFKILKHRPVVLLNTHSISLRTILTGKTLRWADRLMDFIARKEFLAALLFAYEFYSSDNLGMLILSGLPHTKKEQLETVEPFLIQIMTEAQEHFFTGADSPLGLEKALRLYMSLASHISQNRGGPMREDLIEVLEKTHELCDDDETFFLVLEEFIFSRAITNISPVVFKRLVEFYISVHKGERLTEIICLLDKATLNIDLTLKLCEKYDLRLCYAYVWNCVFHDYRTPFEQYARDLDNEKYSHEEKKIIFTYMSYLLSGRQFPTENFMSVDDQNLARDAVCGLLFSNADMGKLASLSGLFPALQKLLHFDSFEVFVTLNEFFESPLLNQEQKGQKNRQYIVDALLEVFELQHFEKLDQVHLAIFLARNYPKYFQFIRLLDAVLQNTVQTLCESNGILHDDCELALECLLPYYNVKDVAYFVEKVKAAKFWNIALNLYKSENNYTGALEVWLEQQNNTHTDPSFKFLADIISTACRDDFSKAEKRTLFESVADNYGAIILKYPDEMIALANAHNPNFHDNVIGYKKEKVAFDYLKRLFGSRDAKVGENKSRLSVEYIRLCCKFEENSVFSLTRAHIAEIRSSDEDLERLKQILGEHHQSDSLAAILIDENKCEEALSTLLDWSDLQLEKLENYINVAIAACEKCELLWKSLVMTLISSSKHSKGHFFEIYNQGLYKCFRRIIDTRGVENSGQLLFTDVLQEIMEQATIQNVRGVLQEILSSYYYEGEIHSLTLYKINEGVKKYLGELAVEKLGGWIVEQKACTSCGKTMWGREAPAKQHAAWEEQARCAVYGEAFDDERYRDCKLIFFKCRHGYHAQCLSGLGSDGVCVLCHE